MNYKRPESVLVVIYTVTGSVLLLQRRDVPSFWQSVTGSLEAGETPRQAAVREVQEETGLVLARIDDCQQQNQFLIQPPWRARYAPTVTHNVEHLFIAALDEAVPVRLNPAEHIAACWLDKAEALRRVSSVTNRAAIEEWV